jgi:hypothetical protein
LSLGVSASACLAFLVSVLIVSDASGAKSDPGIVAYHPSAIKGQTIELEVSLPGVQKLVLEIAGKPEMYDYEPPFIFQLHTKGLWPGRHDWRASAFQSVCCVYSGATGSIQIYPLPRVRAFKVSALVFAGTADVVGLVVAGVTKKQVVRAWSSVGAKTEDNAFSLPLRLRQRHGATRIYRFAHGFSVDARRSKEIYVEVAPKKRRLRHGTEVRGRLAQLELRHNPRSGKTRTHQSRFTACTTVRARKGVGAHPLPASQSCTFAPATPAVSIFCAESMGCTKGTAQRRWLP